MSKIHIQLGALSLAPSKQLAGLVSKPHGARLDRLADAMNRLKVASILRETEMRKAHKRFMELVAQAVEAKAASKKRRSK